MSFTNQLLVGVNAFHLMSITIISDKLLQQNVIKYLLKKINLLELTGEEIDDVDGADKVDDVDDDGEYGNAAVTFLSPV